MAAKTKQDVPDTQIAPPPARPAPATKVEVPGETQDRSNLTRTPSQELVGLNFKIAPELKREIRQYCATHDLKLKELLERMFRAYKGDSSSA